MRNMLFRPDLSLEQVQLLRQYYFGDDAFYNVNLQVDNYTNIFSDIHFNYGFMDSVQLYSKHAPVYVYQFNYVSEFSFFNILSTVRSRFTIGLEMMADRVTSWVKKNVLGMELPRYGKSFWVSVGVSQCNTLSCVQILFRKLAIDFANYQFKRITA